MAKVKRIYPEKETMFEKASKIVTHDRFKSVAACTLLVVYGIGMFACGLVVGNTNVDDIMANVKIPE